MSGHGSMPAIFHARFHEKLTIRNLLTRDGSTFLVKIVFFRRNQLSPSIHFLYRFIYSFIFVVKQKKFIRSYFLSSIDTIIIDKIVLEIIYNILRKYVSLYYILLIFYYILLIAKTNIK